MSQRKINTFFNNPMDNGQQFASYNKSGVTGKDMPWNSSSQKFNPILNRYHNNRREISSQKYQEKMSFSAIKSSQNNYSTGLDSQGNQYSQSQDLESDSCNSLGMEPPSMRSNIGNGSVYNFQVSNQTNQQPQSSSGNVVKQELRQMSNVYQVDCERQQDRKLMNQVVEMSKIAEKQLSSYKEQNSTVQRLILEKIEQLKGDQDERSVTQVKLLESIQLASTSDEVSKNMENISNSLTAAVELIKQDVGKSLNDVETTLTDILKEVKTVQTLRCDVYTQYSPQIHLGKKIALSDVTNSSPLTEIDTFGPRKRIKKKQKVHVYQERFQLKENRSINVIDDEIPESSPEYPRSKNLMVCEDDESAMEETPSRSRIDLFDDSSDGEDVSDWFD